MAARLRARHQDDIRQKIQASQLVNRLTDHAFGKVEMTPSQVQAAKILLDKSVSNAPTEMEHSGPNGGPIKTESTVVMTAEESYKLLLNGS